MNKSLKILLSIFIPLAVILLAVILLFVDVAPQKLNMFESLSELAFLDEYAVETIEDDALFALNNVSIESDYCRLIEYEDAKYRVIAYDFASNADAELYTIRLKKIYCNAPDWHYILRYDDKVLHIKGNALVSKRKKLIGFLNEHLLVAMDTEDGNVFDYQSLTF